ncbi:MAG TPA: hypothetical protein VHD90_20605 [Phototrophicaceae bacterium]|nr:hypothetical protein [Phototrophicaceae bacterium]
MDERAAFRQQKAAELELWEADLERWHTQRESAEGNPQLRREQQQMLDDLHLKREQARHYLDDLDRGGDFNGLKPKMEQLWAQIRTSLTAIKQWA